MQEYRREFHPSKILKSSSWKYVPCCLRQFTWIFSTRGKTFLLMSSSFSSSSRYFFFFFISTDEVEWRKKGGRERKSSPSLHSKKLGPYFDCKKLDPYIDFKKLCPYFNSKKLSKYFASDKFPNNCVHFFFASKTLGPYFDSKKLYPYVDSKKLCQYFNSKMLGKYFSSNKFPKNWVHFCCFQKNLVHISLPQVPTRIDLPGRRFSWQEPPVACEDPIIHLNSTRTCIPIALKVRENSITTCTSTFFYKIQSF